MFSRNHIFYRIKLDICSSSFCRRGGWTPVFLNSWLNIIYYTCLLFFISLSRQCMLIFPSRTWKKKKFKKVQMTCIWIEPIGISVLNCIKVPGTFFYNRNNLYPSKSLWNCYYVVRIRKYNSFTLSECTENQYPYNKSVLWLYIHV